MNKKQKALLEERIKEIKNKRTGLVISNVFLWLGFIFLIWTIIFPIIAIILIVNNYKVGNDLRQEQSRIEFELEGD